MAPPGETIIGRNKEIGIIRDYIRYRKNLHIYGPEGSGKSALLDWIYNNWNDFDSSLIPVYCRNSRTLRKILLCITEFLLKHFKNLRSINQFNQVKKIRYLSDIKKLNLLELKKITFTYITEDNFCVILDHIKDVTPRLNSFLSILYEKALVITASRKSWEIKDYDFMSRLDYSLNLIPKLRIENLQKKDSFLFMEHLYNILNINFPNKLQTFKDIFHVTHGNPKMIKEIFEKAKQSEYFIGDMLNLGLIIIDCKIDNLEI